MEIQFLGAAQTVTGSKTLLKYKDKKILVDCGLFQGPKEKRLLNWEPFELASEIDAVVLTHAHIDHSGYLPKLVKEGFKGPIYCSEGTADLCEILLLDSAYLQEEDARFANKTKHSRHDPALPLYTINDAEKTLDQIQPLPRDKWHAICPGLSFIFKRSGHIIGSSFVQFNYENGHGSSLLTFSGDIGNGRSPILKGPVNITESDFLVLESTYGDRKQPHSSPSEEIAKLIHEIQKTNGVLVIPSFSVGRTQEILYIISQLEKTKQIPNLPVYVDSPMANHATQIFLNHKEDYTPIIEENEFKAPISLADFHAVKSPEDSMIVCMKSGPMIVLSAAGMLTGGRILHHIKHRISNPENIILFAGYQAEGTKGRLLQSGVLDIRIHHQTLPVEARIHTIESLSAHADYEDILDWLDRFEKKPKQIFINHGELPASTALRQKIQDRFKIPCLIPEHNQTYDLKK